MATQQYRLTRNFYAADGHSHLRGAVLPFWDGKDEAEEGRCIAPTSALIVGTPEEKLFASRGGFDGAEKEETSEPETDADPELDLNIDKPTALSKIGGKGGKK